MKSEGREENGYRNRSVSIKVNSNYDKTIQQEGERRERRQRKGSIIELKVAMSVK